MVVDWHQIQDKWQKVWQEQNLGSASVNKNKEKFFMIFAYPGVSGFLHVGHMRGFSYTDAICRFERLKGKEVIFPVGTHASGNQAIAFAKKVQNKDEKWLAYLKNNGCPEETLQTLTNPDAVIEYFNSVYVNDYWKKFGFLCDWDRFTSTTFKDYEKFIQWQFRKLHDKQLLIQKPYYATACITHGPVAVDPSETDISKGGNAEKNEYTLLKFKFSENEFLVAATLRPETVYGQTNLWVNPEAKHVKVEVNGENWILSEEAADKLKYQKDNVLLKEDIDIAKYIGRYVIAPGAEREVIILPSSICNPRVGTGIVTSVPSHAPYDWRALEDLKHDEIQCKKFNLDIEEIKDIDPIALIDVKDWGTHPGKEICEKENIKNQTETEKLEKAKKEIYKAEFHTGMMRENCEKYSGMSVAEAKELVKVDLIDQGKADIFHDLSEEVICRCGEPVVIKRIDDQWFIKYSDPELTERSKEQAKEMKIYPKEYQENMPSVLDWFSDRACVRLGNWLGSKFPFDDKWTVEPISDSTLYPAYYIVSKYVNTNQLTAEDLTEEFFDYVFLAKKPESFAELSETQQQTWNTVKEEFEYFYPLDVNLGGKEHKTVHFPVFLMNHVAILPESKWPKGILVNWWVTGKGSKISKSKGGAEPIPQAIEKYGVDAMRLYYAHIGSPHVDVVWTEDIVLNYKNSLEKINALAGELHAMNGTQKELIDEWILSRMQEHINKINHAMKEYELRELASTTYFSFTDDVRWYIRRGGNNKNIAKEIMNVWSRLMNPITPHFSEELWQMFGNEGLASTASWPQKDQERIHLAAEAGEKLIKTAMDGMRNVVQLAKLEKPQKFQLFVAQNWLYNVFTTLLHEIKVTRNMGEILRKVLEDESLKEKGKEISKLVGAVLKDPTKLPSFVSSQEQELGVMQDAKEFLEKEFSCSVEIINADESEQAKAKAAMPGKVGILVE